MDMFDAMPAAKRALVPKSGFRVVEVDSFSKFGEELTPIADFDTLEDAEAAAERMREESPTSKSYVYAWVDRTRKQHQIDTPAPGCPRPSECPGRPTRARRQWSDPTRNHVASLTAA
jgi:hypothetical protein